MLRILTCLVTNWFLATYFPSTQSHFTFEYSETPPGGRLVDNRQDDLSALSFSAHEIDVLVLAEYCVHLVLLIVTGLGDKDGE